MYRCYELSSKQLSTYERGIWSFQLIPLTHRAEMMMLRGIAQARWSFFCFATNSQTHILPAAFNDSLSH